MNTVNNSLCRAACRFLAGLAVTGPSPQCFNRLVCTPLLKKTGKRASVLWLGRRAPSVPGSWQCCRGHPSALGPIGGPCSTSLTLPELCSRTEAVPAALSHYSLPSSASPSPSASWSRPFSGCREGDRDPQTRRGKRSAKAEEALLKHCQQ